MSDDNDDWFYRNEAEREWSLTLQELDVVRADLARVTAERDRLLLDLLSVSAERDSLRVELDSLEES